MTQSVLLIERPSTFRNALLGALQERGGRVEVCDDALHALARIGELAPDVIAIAEAEGGAAPCALDTASLCRLLERRATTARIYRLGELVANEALPSRSAFVSRVAGAQSIAATLLDEPGIEPLGFACELAPAQLGPLLLWLGEQRASGVLTLAAEGQEREFALVRGALVHARSTLSHERLGALAVKSGAISAEQLEAALMHARAHGIRLGQALVQRGAIDDTALFRLRAKQTLEQLETACASGPYKARFRSDEGIADQLDLFPTHVMTALLGAACRLPVAVVSAALDRAAGRTVTQTVTLGADNPAAGAVARWLTGIGASFDLEAPSLGALRTRAIEQLAQQSAEPAAGKADAIVLAWVASGAVSLGERSSSTGTPSRPPPLGMSAGLLRALDLRAPFTPPTSPAAAITPASDAWQRVVDEALLGPSACVDRKEQALGGPELEPLPAALQRLYVRLKSAQSPLESLGLAFGANRAQLDLAHCEQLNALDRACEDEQAGAVPAHVRLRKLELRRALDRAHAALGRSLPVAQPPRVIAAQGVASAEKPAQAPPAPSSGAFAELDPLVRQGRWHEVATRIEQLHPTGTDMPAGIALLYSIALKEAPPTPARAAQLAQSDRLAVRAMGELLGVAEESASALVIAKRTLRKRPLEWQKEPPRRVSITLMLAALFVGAGVGLSLSHQSLHWPF